MFIITYTSKVYQNVGLTRSAGARDGNRLIYSQHIIVNNR